jgi:hypothetical protein
MNGSSDSEQLAFACRQGWMLYTSNARDFNVLHREYMESGRTRTWIIIRYERQFSIGEQARRIERIWRALSAQDISSRVESLSQ